MSKKYEDGEIVVRTARKEDLPVVAEMIQELTDSRQIPHGPKVSVEDLEQNVFEHNPPAFKCIVAEVYYRGMPTVVGYARYYIIYSSWPKPTMMIEDLYVRTNERRHGVGKKLFYYVAKEVSPSGCSQLEFRVLAWDPARKFYESKGATNLTDYAELWCYYQVSGDVLHNIDWNDAC